MGAHAGPPAAPSSMPPRECWRSARRPRGCAVPPLCAARVPGPQVLYDYTRGCALLALGRHEEGAAHLAALRERLPALPDVVAGEGEVAALVLGAAVDVHRSHDARAAEAKLRAAAARQADWGYTEPPRWHQPVADCLGQVRPPPPALSAGETTFGIYYSTVCIQATVTHSAKGREAGGGWCIN